jgi:hypothetical protein
MKLPIDKQIPALLANGMLLDLRHILTSLMYLIISTHHFVPKNLRAFIVSKRRTDLSRVTKVGYFSAGLLDVA